METETYVLPQPGTFGLAPKIEQTPDDTFANTQTWDVATGWIRNKQSYYVTKKGKKMKVETKLNESRRGYFICLLYITGRHTYVGGE